MTSTKQDERKQKSWVGSGKGSDSSWGGRRAGRALPEIRPKPPFHVTTISRGRQFQSCLKMHQSQGHKNSQGCDYAFEGRQKSPLVWLRWSLTKEEKDNRSKNRSTVRRMTRQPPSVYSGVKGKSFFSVSGSLGVRRENPRIGGDLDALAGWPLQLSFT